jgi:hypothetical protein
MFANRRKKIANGKGFNKVTSESNAPTSGLAATTSEPFELYLPVRELNLDKITQQG